MTDDRTEMAEARTAGLRARHETREARAADKLVEIAYREIRDEFLTRLYSRIAERDRWIAEADDETRAFWLKLRARGIPDRTAELSACQRLADEIRQIGAEETPS